MLTTLHRSAWRGYTLVEIMIVVALLTLLVMIGVPGYIRARKRSQATRILSDLRIIDSAINQYAVDSGKSSGNSVVWEDLRVYFKTGSTLYSAAGLDLLGNPFEVFTVDAAPGLSLTSFAALSDVAPSEFWSPYR